MQFKSIVAAAAIALIVGVGSVSADENDVADTAVNTGAPFALLDGIPNDQMSVHELAATRGAGSPFNDMILWERALLASHGEVDVADFVIWSNPFGGY